MEDDLLICPVCGRMLTKTGNVFQCPQSHSFDISQEGYVNLLLSGRKKSKVRGDTREMLQARRAFLNRGYYRVLSDTVCRLVYEHLTSKCNLSARTAILDVGCGEGYYLSKLKSYLDRELSHAEIRYFGMDLSKDAARLAAKRDQNIRFVVADTKRKVLFVSGAIRVAVNIFAPRNPMELARVLSQDGVLLVVIPGAEHLLELRMRLDLLAIEKDKEAHVIEQLSGLFVLSQRQTVEQLLSLGSEEVLRLLKMTPNYWHLRAATFTDLDSGGRILTRARFVILEFHERPQERVKE